MFEQELELEKKEGGAFGPVLIIVLLAGILVGGIGYVVYMQRQTLKPEEAATVVQSIFKAKGPAVVHFQTGHVEATLDDKPTDPHYRLLEKAGLVKVARDKKTLNIDVALAPDAEKMISSFPEFQKKSAADGKSVAYVVPLADRKLVAVTNVTKITPTKFVVEYTWNWTPNKMGDIFDISGQYVKDFNTWDRSVLIDKYGVDFYHAEPKKASVTLVKVENGWKPSTE